MTRIESLPEEQLVQQINALRTDLNELKTKQRLGAANVMTYQIKTPNAYDANLTIPAYSWWQLNISLPTSQQNYAKATISWRMYLGSMSNEIFPNFGTSPYYPTVKCFALPPDTSAPLQSKWTFWIFNNNASSQNYLIKFYVASTDRGA